MNKYVILTATLAAGLVMWANWAFGAEQVGMNDAVVLGFAVAFARIIGRVEGDER